jgi:hypothetical protein
MDPDDVRAVVRHRVPMAAFPSRVVVALAVVSCVSGCLKEERMPIDYRLPTNFEGGFAVLYNVKTAPPLPIVDGRIQITVPAGVDPIIETSSMPSGGWARDRYHMAGQILNPKLIKHSAIAAVSDTCLFEHAVVGPPARADAALQTVVQKLKTRCGL